MRLVLIDWLDSYGCSSDWRHIESCNPKVLHCRSVGWILYEDADCIVIVPHLSDSEHHSAPQQACGDMTIPFKAIVSITDLQTIKASHPVLAELHTLK